MSKEQNQDKELYSFTVTSVKEVEEVSVTTDDTGAETKITKKVKKETPTRIMIRRPSRRQVDDAGMEYTIKLSDLMKKGILTKAMMTKKYADTGGVLTESEALYLTTRYKKLNDIQREFVGLSIKVDSLDEAGKAKLSQVTDDINNIRREIANLESQYSFIFQHSADTKADTHIILWYSLMLSQIEEQKDGAAPTYTPFFKGTTFEEKLEDYYQKEETGDLFYLNVRQKLAYFVSWWVNGAISSKEDFAQLEQDIDAGKL